MALGVDYKLLMVERAVGQNTGQIQLNNSFQLPHPALEISNLIASVKQVKTKIIENKVLVEGKVHQQIYYVDEQHLVRYTAEEFDFDGFVDLPGAAPGMEVKVGVRIEHLDCDLIIARGEKLSKIVEQSIVLELTARVIQPVQVRVAIGVEGLPGNCQLSKEKIKVDSVIGEGESEQQLENSFLLPKMAVEICDLVADLRELNVKVIENKVIVQGEVYKKIYYLGLDSLIHHCLEKTSFETFAEVPGAKPGMNGTAEVKIESIDHDFTIPSGENCYNKIDQTIIIKTKVKVLQTVQLDVLTNVVGPGIDLDLQQFTVASVVGENAAQTQLKNSWVLPKMAVEIFDLKAEFKQIETEVIKDKVLIEGIIEKQIYYVGADLIVHHHKEEVKFDYFVEVRGAVSGMKAIISPKIENIDFDLKIPEGYDVGNRIEQTITLQILAKVTQEKQLNLITRLELIFISPTVYLDCPPSFSFYVVQKGDTLWKIAKRYGVSLETIISSNPQLENPDLIYPGQKICVPLGQCIPVFNGKG